MASNQPANVAELAQTLRDRLADVEPLEEEKDFFTKDETIFRFLKARAWDLKEAEKQLRSTIEWRRQYKPLTVDCRWCHDHPGYHSMRQVGFDEQGRPVIYSCFAQARTRKNTVEDSVAHCTYLIENAKRSMKPGVGTWVFVIDCTGMSINTCDTKMGSGVIDVFSNYFPERLGKIVCLNHNPIFHGLYQAVKVFIDPNTAQKMKLIRNKEKLVKNFKKLFSDELSEWLQEEIRLNKIEPIPESQVRFWEANEEHDPRGCPSYVKEFVEPLVGTTICRATTSLPHPNLVDQCEGKELTPFDPEEEKEKKKREEKEREEQEKEKKAKEKEEEKKKKEEEKANGTSAEDVFAPFANIMKKLKPDSTT